MIDQKQTPDPARLLTPSTGGLWRAKQAADFLAISERHLWSLTKAGTIPCVRLGTAIRYDPGDLRAMIEGRKERPAKNYS